VVAPVSLADEELMLLVQAGNLHQLTFLFERYQTPLFTFLTRLNYGDEQTGQDLTQNVFLRVLKYRASYRPGERFRTWLYQLARRVHADHWQQVRPTGPDPDTLEQTAAHSLAAHAQFAAASQAHALQDALNHLPDAQREVLVLHHLEGFDYAEVGQFLGCSAGAARMKAHRALEALRTLFFAD